MIAPSPSADLPIDAPPSVRSLSILTLLFVGSGAAALIYEIVWLQLLQFVVGSSAVSLGVLLGTFMGGMCLGSLLVPRWISSAVHPLRAYAGLEAALGLCGILVMLAVPLVGSVYSAWFGEGVAGYALRGAVAAVCLLPPTLLMGGTLPVIARAVDTTPGGVTWLSLFYGGNLAGAVCGCLLAGFYLLRVHDSLVATEVAAGTNFGVALIAWLLARRVSYRPPGQTDERIEAIADTAPKAGRIHLAIALSGLCALGSEVIWTRLLSLLLGGTVYTFSMILAVFLVGLGIGSGFGARLGRSGLSPRLLLGCCQFLLVAAIGWGAWQLAAALPWWPMVQGRSAWLTMELDLIRCVWVVLPAACLWGASFPLALAAAASPGEDPAALVARIYAANTLGAIAGAIGFSTLFIGWVGTHQSQQLLMLVSILAGVIVLWPTGWRQSDPADGARRRILPRLAGVGCVLAVAALGVGLVRVIPPVPGEAIAHGRNTFAFADKGTILYQGEGLNSSVAVQMLYDGARSFHVSGKVEAASAPKDMRLQRMLGHIPALMHPAPRSVLVVGCGAGVTAGSFLAYPEVERVVVCEIEPLVANFVATYFRDENQNIVDDPRVRFHFDDARHFILTTDETFDIITSDPIHPWVKGAATLYTTEYFELCKRHLNEGGMITQWVPLYESETEVVKSELATLFSVFPEGSVWAPDNIPGGGPELVALVHREPLRVDVDRLLDRLKQADHRDATASLAAVGFLSGLDLLASYGSSASDLVPWLKDAQLNHDRNLRLQYLAGWGLNTQRSGQIYDEILACRTFPEANFVGSRQRMLELKLRLESGKEATRE